MISRSYFGKMNSTLGSVVPLAMFSHFVGRLLSMDPLSILNFRRFTIAMGFQLFVGFVFVVLVIYSQIHIFDSSVFPLVVGRLTSIDPLSMFNPPR